MYGAKLATAAPSLLYAALIVPLYGQTGLSPEVRRLGSGPFWNESTAENSKPANATHSEPAEVVSADLLRQPINNKARHLLQKAVAAMNAGKHELAMEKFQEVLSKFPASEAYVHPLLGVEYLRTDQFAAAVSSLAKAVQLLPHDAFSRYNLGLSLICTGDYASGEQVVRQALELDPHNARIQAFLTWLDQWKQQ